MMVRGGFPCKMVPLVWFFFIYTVVFAGNKNSNSSPGKAKIAFITASFGTYEKRLKQTVPQTIPCDWICFTDNHELAANGWTMDYTAYHHTHPSRYDDGKLYNSLALNKHPFNVAKYYKQQFQLIPRLKDYQVIVWLDASLQIRQDRVANWVYDKMMKNNTKIIGFAHERHNGSLIAEVRASMVLPRYKADNWLDIPQRPQHIDYQYAEYVQYGYNDAFWDEYALQHHINNPNLGVWMTAMVMFDNKDGEVSNFLDYWYLQTLKYSTQDQVSFSFVAQHLHLVPYTLPDKEITGYPHQYTSFYVRLAHGFRRR